MDGKFDDNLDLIWAKRGIAVSGPLQDWDDDETSASIHVSIVQGGVAALGRTGDDVPSGADKFILAAAVEGDSTLAPGPASAAGWALVRSSGGIEMYKWSVPVTLSEPSPPAGFSASPPRGPH